jgi:neprilysin
VIPDDDAFVTDYSEIGRKLNNQLWTIVAEPIKDEEIEPFKNVKRLYRACQDTSLIELRGIAPIKNLIDSLGGWPVVDGTNWNEGNWTWQKNIKDSTAVGLNHDHLFTFGISTDNRNRSRKVFFVRQFDLLNGNVDDFTFYNCRWLVPVTRFILHQIIATI